VNLNTAAFDASGTLWFTGQGGVYGRLDPATGGSLNHRLWVEDNSIFHHYRSSG
jgi:streptogramin lyase